MSSSEVTSLTPEVSKFLQLLVTKKYTSANHLLISDEITARFLREYRDGLGRNILQKSLLAADSTDQGSNLLIESLLKLMPSAATHASHNGNTALHFASASSTVDILQKIVKMSPVPCQQKKNTRGRTPLNIAAGSNLNTETVGYLLFLSPAQLFVKDKKGILPHQVRGSKLRIRDLQQQTARSNVASNYSLHSS